MGNKVNRYARVYSQFLKNSIGAEMEYRASFIFKNLASMVWMVGAIFFIQVLFTQASHIGGWSKEQVLLVYIAFSLASDFLHVFVRKNFEKFSTLTQKGELDWLLLRPINTRFMVSFMTSGIDLHSILRLFAGFGLLIYFLPVGTTFLNVVWFFILLLLGIFSLYSFAYILHTLNIWLIKLDNITHLSFMTLELSRVPLDSWPSGIRILLVYFIPVALISTFSVQALITGPDAKTIFTSLFVATALFVASQKFWTFALRHYASASS